MSCAAKVGVKWRARRHKYGIRLRCQWRDAFMASRSPPPFNRRKANNGRGEIEAWKERKRRRRGGNKYRARIWVWLERTERKYNGEEKSAKWWVTRGARQRSPSLFRTHCIWQCKYLSCVSEVLASDIEWRGARSGERRRSRRQRFSFIISQKRQSACKLRKSTPKPDIFCFFDYFNWDSAISTLCIEIITNNLTISLTNFN